MRMRFKDLPIGSCFTSGRAGLEGRNGKSGEVKKKVDERKACIVKDNGKVNTRKVKGDPDVEQLICPLRYLGVGLRKHPDLVVEIGDGNILEGRKKRR